MKAIGFATGDSSDSEHDCHRVFREYMKNQRQRQARRHVVVRMVVHPMVVEVELEVFQAEFDPASPMSSHAPPVSQHVLEDCGAARSKP